MKLNFDTPVLDLEGNPFKEKDKVVTQATHIAGALANVVPENYVRDGLKKAWAGAMAVTFFKGGDIELTAEDIVMLKDWIGCACSPLAIDQIFKTLTV